MTVQGPLQKHFSVFCFQGFYSRADRTVSEGLSGNVVNLKRLVSSNCAKADFRFHEDRPMLILLNSPRIKTKSGLLSERIYC